MDIRQLKYFIAVVENQGFSRAAESLYLSQSTLSKVVKNLENELNTTLIDRSNQKIELTEAGKVVYQQGIQILLSLDNISNELFDIENLKKGHINIGIPPITGTLYFPKIIQSFNNLYPNIEIIITEGGAHKIKNALLDGSIDIAVSMKLNDDENLDVLPLDTDTLVLYVNDQHPLAQKDVIEMSDLIDEKFITLDSDFELRKLFAYECYKNNFSPRIIYESAQWDFILAMVNEGIGLTIMPKSLSNLLNYKHLKVIPINNSNLTMDVNFLIKKQKPISTPLQTFIRYTTDQIAVMKKSNI
ncbi:LysR family transcriptional regulator [Mammaliicoccus sciuri]|uniref:LysR family transcriptional regulator n=1 Tax=Mammaliicoccus sciuri TaxID=1296 RepID=UPI001E45BD96|nr:LysR family transcriptional regulator [Mammaliicoccus sciuri]MCD8895306.1 LysR family transcriptional regulator [Mammaliicoccus sciuri]MCD8913469.1 LysR family transcriptional regulator [Mammaliicoccus sciuri]